MLAIDRRAENFGFKSARYKCRKEKVLNAANKVARKPDGFPNDQVVPPTH